MQYGRTHMDVELTVDYDNTINKWRWYTIDGDIPLELMLMVHQPAVEISIGDISNQYERENRHAAMI